MRKPGTLYKAAVIAMHALVGWAYCGVLIGVGWQFLPMHTALVVHAVGAPVGFASAVAFLLPEVRFHEPLANRGCFPRGCKIK